MNLGLLPILKQTVSGGNRFSSLHTVYKRRILRTAPLTYLAGRMRRVRRALAPVAPTQVVSDRNGAASESLHDDGPTAHRSAKVAQLRPSGRSLPEQLQCKLKVPVVEGSCGNGSYVAVR